MGIEYFELPVAALLRVQSRSGAVHVIAEPRDDVAVEGSDIDALLEREPLALRVRSGRGNKKLTVRCPVGTDVMVGTQSGSVSVEGELGAVKIATMSGSVAIDRADHVDVRTMSGSVSVSGCDGRCRVATVSGSIRSGESDSAYASSTSGSIDLGRVMGEVRAQTVSGTVRVAAQGEGRIAIKTVSGKVRVELPDGTEPDLCSKTRGRVECSFPPGDDVRIEAVSVSGTIEVVPG
jgi:DUF4097 and DUF4098 domain-containing protein YvlB